MSSSSNLTDRVTNFVERNNPLKNPKFAEEAERAVHYNYGPISILAAFAGSHLILQHRIPKLFYGIDNNVYPREDLEGGNGEKLVAQGKITAKQLRRLKRWQAAHYNAVEHLPVFVGAILSLQFAGASNRLINRVAGTYLTVRTIYAGLYIGFETEAASMLRTIAWWSSNITCIYAFIEAAKKINHNVATGTTAL
ncbi:hypothetical protein BCV70DRAFT_202920 [Testicularia cyperi]|uniref:Membrane-associated proteins in eicosanoid and glutathione metabolism n=1 Tax=Testicularia cyperi TaxID=1882483 RepID=A0A317XGB9_9BASI|nr:hypothetical protein BCV70DRAFT_202920 [Testicularia cyperi]